jgi:4-hydroxy-4-methyl-2-oxoglutarate aldolase
MIDDPPLLTIRRNFVRPDPAHVLALQGVPTGYVVDAMNGRGALAPSIKPIPGTPATLCGVAMTCDCGPDDNLALFGAVAYGARGDVLLCATNSFTGSAVTGDLLLGMAKNRGLAGFVTDGMVRDTPGIIAVGLPCYAAGVTPNSPVRNGPGRVGLPIVVGGVAADAGDIVIADMDGAVIVPRLRVPEVIARLVRVRAAEAAMEAKLRAGLQVPPFIQELIDAGRFNEVP